MVYEDLELLFMASEHSNTECLPRIWAIEALACSKQLNTSELIDLIRRTPELSDDIGKNARELVSLRILETLFVEGNQNNRGEVSALCQKIKFDPSNSCEDVLHHIFQEMSASSLKLGASEMLKWDVKSFIAHKRDCLPVFALQKLKDAVLEGSHSFFASLKERSGVVVRTQCNDDILDNGVNPNTPGQRLEEKSKDTQIVLLPNQNSSPKSTESGIEELQEKLRAGSSLPSKRNRTDISAENLEREDQIIQDNHYDPYAESAKKFKQDIHITDNIAVENSIKSARDGLLVNSPDRIIEDIDTEVCNLENEAEIGGMEMEHTGTPRDACNNHAAEKLKQVVNITELATVVKPITSAGDEPLADSSERTIEHIDREGCNLEKEAEIGGTDIKHTDTTYSGDDQCAALKTLTGSSDIVDAGNYNCQLQNPINDNMEVNMPGELQGKSNYADGANDHMEGFEAKSSNGTFLGANEECNNINEATNSFHHNLQGNTPTCCEANDGTEHNEVLETATDSDNYHDERNDIASKKKAFLSSQCTYSEDSLATQPNFCMKCNSGGQLLICSSSICPLVVHENCLGTAAKFDGDGKFYCPFCAYSRAISEYSEAKRKASLARKDLANFIGLKVGRRPELPIRSHRSTQNEVRGVDDVCENNEANIHRDRLDEVVHTRTRPNVEDKLQAEPSTSCAGNGLPCGETVADLTHGEPKTLKNGNLQGEGKEQQCQSPFLPGEQQTEVQAPHKSDDISSHKQVNIVRKNERQTITRGQERVKHPPESSLSSEPPCQTSCESSEEDDDKSSASKYSMRPRRQEMQYTYPAIPLLRRKRHPWTKVEEEKLKEGVDKFSSPQDLSIPWKTILEFGANVFEKGRTTVDLKDKWRNMCKVGPKSK